jgi:hypothetical protein
MDLTGYELETLRDDGELALYRARQHRNPVPVLVLAPVAGRAAFWSLKRLEHEYALAAELVFQFTVPARGGRGGSEHAGG